MKNFHQGQKAQREVQKNESGGLSVKMDTIYSQAVMGGGKLFKKRINGRPAVHRARNPIMNQNGSLILIAMMVLVIMTVIGLMSSRTVVTENYIIRNQGIYKQNVNMVESALMEGLQRFMQLAPDDQDIVDVNGSGLAWVNNMDDTWAAVDWYAQNSSALILNAGNSMDFTVITADRSAIAQDLTNRGEAATGNLRVAFVGWDIVTVPGGGSESLGVGSNDPVWREGRIIGEYASRTAGGADHGYGMLRMEIGVKRRIVIN